jgi:hypothetical protein
MTESDTTNSNASQYVLALAFRTAAAYLAHAYPRAMMLSGSA